MKTLNAVFVMVVLAALVLMANSNPKPEKYTEYLLVAECGADKKAREQLNESINLKIKDGWQPIGGTAVSGAGCIYQVIVR